MLKTILRFHEKAKDLFKKGANVADIFGSDFVVKIARMKYIERNEVETSLNELMNGIDGLTPQKFGVEDR